MLPKLFSTRFGSKLGDDTITRTFPVRGSSATTAPHFVPSCSSATCCASRSRFTHDVVALDRLAAELVERLVDARSRGSRSRRSGSRSATARGRSSSARRSSSRRRAPRTGPVGSGGRTASCRRPSGALFTASRLNGELETIFPRSIENSATRLIALSCRSASAGAAHVCQYVVMTTSAPTSASATYVRRTMRRFTAWGRSPGSRRGGGPPGARSSRRCSSRRTRRTAA